MIFFNVFLLRLKFLIDKFCKELDRVSMAVTLKEKTLTVDQYRHFLIQLYFYIVPGPELLASDRERMAKEKDGDFTAYLNAHYEIERDLCPLILKDLHALGADQEFIDRTGPSAETLTINDYVYKLHHRDDPVLILVSDIAAKILLDIYTDRITAAIKPKLEHPDKGIDFLTKDTKAQIDIKDTMLRILKKRIRISNSGIFLKELDIIFTMFKKWLESVDEKSGTAHKQ